MKAIFLVLLLALAVEASAAPRQRLSAFELGKRQYEQGHHARALDLFSQAILTTSDPSLRNKAYYYQGLVLFELGYFYSSYISFRNVLLTADDKSKEVYEKAIKNAVYITDKLSIVEKIGKALDKLPVEFIPTAVMPYANYAIGVYHFSIADNDNATARLKSVNPENQFYPKALFYLGILATRRKDYKESIFYFEKVLEQARGKREMVDMAELARLNLARSVYSSGDIERSIEVYSQFLSTSPHWLTVMLEAGWPLMRVNDTTVSLGNLHTILSPFYREDMVGEAYVLRATILFSLCKYEEMRQTLSQFFSIYDPVVRSMQQEENSLGSADGYYAAYMAPQKGFNRAFVNFVKRDAGVANEFKVLDVLREERKNISRFTRNEMMRKIASLIDEADKSLTLEIGHNLQKLHKRKLADLMEQREQANYLKVEIVTGEKELIEGQKGLPPRRVVDVETSVAAGYHFWPFQGEFWEDELGTYVYTTESSCVN